MSAVGFTPIQLYYSATASQAPSAGNLANGELAINITDGKLFYKDNGGVVQVLATKGAGTIGGSNTQVQYNNAGALAGSANLTFDGTTLTAAGLAGPHNGTVGASTPNTGAFTTLSASSTVTLSGGTANGVAYLNGSKVLTSGSALTFDGTNFTLNTGYMSFGNNGYIRADSANNKLTFQAGTSGYLWKDQANSGDWMALTSTGLGIGTSSPQSKLHVVDGGGVLRTFDNTDGIILTSYSASKSIGFSTSSAGNYGSDGGSNTFLKLTPGASGTMLFGTGGAVAATLSASGNLGLGVTPSAWGGGYKAIEILGYLGLGVAGGTTQLFTNAYYNGSNYIYRNTAAATYYAHSAGSHIWATAPSGTAGNAISFTQAMTLDASGSLLVGLTSSISPDTKLHLKNTTSTQTVAWVWNATGSGNADLIAFATESSITQRGSIVYNRGLGLVSYNTTSDYRAKDIIGPVTNSGEVVDAIQVHEGKMHGAKQSRPMFVAHELQGPAPYCVTGEKDAVDAEGNPVYQQVDHTPLIPVLVAEIQSLRKRLAAAGIA